MSERTRYFSDTELRLLVFRLKGSDSKELLAEFQTALDERIRAKLGLAEPTETKRDPVE